MSSVVIRTRGCKPSKKKVGKCPTVPLLSVMSWNLVETYLHAFLTSALDGGKRSVLSHHLFTLGKMIITD
jgi:hypothetical protein